MVKVKKCSCCKKFLELCEFDFHESGKIFVVCRRCTYRRRIKDHGISVFDPRFESYWSIIAAKHRSVKLPLPEDIIPIGSRKRRSPSAIPKNFQ